MVASDVYGTLYRNGCFKEEPYLYPNAELNAKTL